MNTVLVLNADFQPLNITSFQRGFNLVYKGKAEVVEADPEHTQFTSTRGRKYRRPVVIRLIRFIYIPYKKVPLSKYNLFRRDGYKCGYCGDTENLTMDHVIPKSRGGRNSWSNLVTCCKKCNGRKDNKTPQEANMVLNVKLYQPTFKQFINAMKVGTNSKWKDYL